MKQWSDVLPQARQVVRGVRNVRAVRRNVFEGDPKYYEDWYDMNCAFLLECGFHIEMPQWLGMCGEYPWGSN